MTKETRESEIGGPEGTQTLHLFNAIEALYQMSYKPENVPATLWTRGPV